MDSSLSSQGPRVYTREETMRAAAITHPPLELHDGRRYCVDVEETTRTGWVTYETTPTPGPCLRYGAEPTLPLSTSFTKGEAALIGQTTHPRDHSNTRSMNSDGLAVALTLLLLLLVTMPVWGPVVDRLINYVLYLRSVFILGLEV